MTNKFKILTIIITLSFFVFSISFATTTFFEGGSDNIQAGDIFESSFFIDTEGQDINALQGTITFSDKSLSLKEINDGNSIINFWIDRPVFKNNEISFSGIIPGGYSSGKGLIFTLVFQSLELGSGLIEVKDLKVLANDGSGTPVTRLINNDDVVQISERIIKDSNISSSTSSYPTSTLPVKEIEEKDVTPPEIFEPKIASDSTVFDGRYFLVFTTQDKEAGIDHYEVLEKKTLNIFSHDYIIWQSGWVNAENMYVLKDQNTQSSITVKAIDKVGNERIVVIKALKPIFWYQIWWFWVIPLIALTITLLAVYFGLRMLCKIDYQKK